MNAKNVLSSPLRYLDKALNGLRDLGLMPQKADEMPVVTLINQISDLDEEDHRAIPAGSLLGGGGGSVKGAIGGGVMAMLGALAFSALKGTGSSGSQEMPVGLQQPENPQQEEELEQGAELVLKAMLNAAKADGTIDAAEIQRILGKMEEADADSDARDFVINEMNKPMDLSSIVAAAKGRPQLAAPIYAASLLAIEVDTPAERQYMQQLADDLYLTPEITAHLEKTVGL